MFFKNIIYTISKANIYHPSFHMKKKEFKDKRNTVWNNLESNFL